MSDPTSLGHEWGGADLVAKDAQARVFRLPTYDTSRVWHHAFGHEVDADDACLCSFCAAEAMPSGVCVITTYRRALNRAKAQARRSRHFSAQVRRALLTQAAGRCRQCGAVEALEVDHIVPIGLGGNNDLRNGWVRCRDCHLAKTRAERVFGLNRDGHRESGLSWEAAQQRRFTPETFLAALREQTGWSVEARQ